MMQWLVWGGATLSLLGLIGILWTIFAVSKARRADPSPEVLKARMERIMPINIGALMLSVLGLGMVTIGLILS